MDPVKEPEYEVTDRVTKTFGNLTVTEEVSNTAKCLARRLVCGDEASHWTTYYQGILSLTVDGRTFISVTDYFSGHMPIEQPVELITGK